MLVLLISVGVVALVVVLLSVGILLRSNGRFPDTHVGSNPAMRERGIACHTSQHRDAQTARGLRERIAGRDS